MMILLKLMTSRRSCYDEGDLVKGFKQVCRMTKVHLDIRRHGGGRGHISILTAIIYILLYIIYIYIYIPKTFSLIFCK